MIAKNLIEEDIELKNMARNNPADHKPRFNWAGDPQAVAALHSIPVMDQGERKLFTQGDIATIIGEALTDLMLVRQEQEIFTDKNRQLVAQIAHAVSDELASRCRGSGEDDRSAIKASEVTRIIERTLIRRNAYDLARSIVVRYQNDSPPPDDTPFTQLTPTTPR